MLSDTTALSRIIDTSPTRSATTSQEALRTGEAGDAPPMMVARDVAGLVRLLHGLIVLSISALRSTMSAGVVTAVGLADTVKNAPRHRRSAGAQEAGCGSPSTSAPVRSAVPWADSSPSPQDWQQTARATPSLSSSSADVLQQRVRVTSIRPMRKASGISSWCGCFLRSSERTACFIAPTRPLLLHGGALRAPWLRRRVVVGIVGTGPGRHRSRQVAYRAIHGLRRPLRLDEVMA